MVPSLVQGLEGRWVENDELVKRLHEEHQTLQTDSHSYFTGLSLGLDINKLPLHRFLPVRFYIDVDDVTTVETVKDATTGLLDSLDIAIADELPSETGSFFGKWFGKTKDAVTHDQVTSRIEKIERSMELYGLEQPQAQVNKLNAEAAGTLLKSLEPVKNAAVHIGSILLIKTTDKNGNASVQIKTLSAAEIIFLEKNQKALKDPTTVMDVLAECATQSILGDALTAKPDGDGKAVSYFDETPPIAGAPALPPPKKRGGKK